jgi:hypothetical protein
MEFCGVVRENRQRRPLEQSTFNIETHTGVASVCTLKVDSLDLRLVLTCDRPDLTLRTLLSD